MNTRLIEWIEYETEGMGTPVGKFHDLSFNRDFLKMCLAIAYDDRKTWDTDEILNIRIFRRIRRGSAVPVKDYWNYYIDENSKIYRVGGWAKELRKTQTVKGYWVVNLNDGKQKTFLVHRLVADYHVENPDPEKLVDVHHLSNDMSNNNKWNLMWVTHLANIRLRDNTTSPSRDSIYSKIEEYICAYCGEIKPPT